MDLIKVVNLPQTVDNPEHEVQVLIQDGDHNIGELDKNSQESPIRSDTDLDAMVVKYWTKDIIA